MSKLPQRNNLTPSDEQLRDTYIENFPGIAYVARLDFVPLFFEGLVEEITGYRPEEFMAGNPRWDEIIVEDDLQNEDFGFDAIRTQPGLKVEREYRIRKKNGDIAWIHDVIRNVTDEEGNIVRVAGTLLDVSRRKELEEERQQLQEQVLHTQKLESLGVMAGGIAHDFNNLLMGILGNASVLKLDLDRSSSMQDVVDEIEKTAVRASDLCRQMLAYSGKGRFVVESVNFSDLVREMAHLLEVSISKNVVLRSDLATDLPAVSGDATQLTQIVMNLITNASEAMEDSSGVISLATGTMYCDKEYLLNTYVPEDIAEGTYVFLEVSDTGCGMDDETKLRLFDPFFTTKFTGRGLGLSAVLGIVRGHTGAIKIYTEPGKGTSIKVLFPALEGECLVAKQEEVPHSADWTAPFEGTILLVDDEETIRSAGRRMLKRLGFNVLLACDGREAVEVLRGHADEVNCVILDLTMPNMGGEECFSELRRIRHDVAVLLSSGYNEQDVTQQFTGKGLAGFIKKPYAMNVLTEKLRKILSE